MTTRTSCSGATATRRSTTSARTGRRIPPRSARCCSRGRRAKRSRATRLVLPARRLDVPGLLRLGADRDARGPRRRRGLPRHRGPPARRAGAARARCGACVARGLAAADRGAGGRRGGVGGGVRRHRPGGRSRDRASAGRDLALRARRRRRPWSAPGAIDRIRSRPAPAGRWTARRSPRWSWRPAAPRGSRTSARSPARLPTPPARPGSAHAPARRSSSTATSGARWAPGSTEREPLPDDIEDRLAEFTELVATAISNSASREELARLADEQAALRRVATLVARGVPPRDVFAAVAREVGRLLGVDVTHMARVRERRHRDGGGRLEPRRTSMVAVGTRRPLDGEQRRRSWSSRTRPPARIDGYDGCLRRTAASRGPELGIRRRSAPDRRRAAAVGRADRLLEAEAEPLPADTESRLANFTELVATAISNSPGAGRGASPRGRAGRAAARGYAGRARIACRARSSPRSRKSWDGCSTSTPRGWSASRTTTRPRSSRRGAGCRRSCRSARACRWAGERHRDGRRNRAGRLVSTTTRIATGVHLGVRAPAGRPVRGRRHRSWSTDGCGAR